MLALHYITEFNKYSTANAESIGNKEKIYYYLTTTHMTEIQGSFTLQVRPILKKTGRGPSLKTMMIQDCLALSFMILTLASVIFSSYTLAVLAGMFFFFFHLLTIHYSLLLLAV